MGKKSLGKHILIDMYHCDISKIKTTSQVKKIMIAAAKIAKAKIVKSTFHKFSPYGISGVVVISESHFAIHTWPEYKCVAIDMFTCSEKMKTSDAIKLIAKKIRAKEITVKKINRSGRILITA